MEHIANFLLNSGPVIVAGGFGGVMRWALLRPKAWDGIINIGVGGVLAYYGTPVAVPALAKLFITFTAELPNIEQITGFTLGVVGIGIIGWIIEVATGWMKKYKAKSEGEALTVEPVTNNGVEK